MSAEGRRDVVDRRSVRVSAIGREPGLAGPMILAPDAMDMPAALKRHDPVHATVVEGDGTKRRIILLPADGPPETSGVSRRRIVVVDGWEVEVEIESERRATLRDRARREDDASAHRGPTEIRAIIPGRVAAVSVVPGDTVVLGQALLVVEAMKMQNQLRAPRNGVVSNVAVGAGQTIEVGDLLLALQ